jgi:hypothetical protein
MGAFHRSSFFGGIPPSMGMMNDRLPGVTTSHRGLFTIV